MNLWVVQIVEHFNSMPQAEGSLEIIVGVFSSVERAKQAIEALITVDEYAGDHGYLECITDHLQRFVWGRHEHVADFVTIVSYELDEVDRVFAPVPI